MSLTLRLLALAACMNLLGSTASAQDGDPEQGAPPQGAPQQGAPQPGTRGQPDERQGADPEQGAPDARIPDDDTAEPSRAGDDGTVLRTGEVIGGDVVDSSSRRLGRITDLVTDDSGDVIAVVERTTGDTVGFPLARLRPSDAGVAGLDASRGAPRRFAMQGDPEGLTAAPRVPVSGRLDGTWMSELRDHFRLATVRTDATGAGSADVPGATTAGDAGRGDAGRGTRSAGAADVQPWRLASFSGSTLRSGQGDDLGRVDDLAIAFPEGRVSYALVSRGDGQTITLHGVAIDDLTRTQDGRSFTTRLGSDEFDRARAIEGDRLPRDPSVGRGRRGDSPRDGVRGGSRDQGGATGPRGADDTQGGTRGGTQGGPRGTGDTQGPRGTGGDTQGGTRGGSSQGGGGSGSGGGGPR